MPQDLIGRYTDLCSAHYFSLASEPTHDVFLSCSLLTELLMTSFTTPLFELAIVHGCHWRVHIQATKASGAKSEDFEYFCFQNENSRRLIDCLIVIFTINSSAKNRQSLFLNYLIYKNSLLHSASVFLANSHMNHCFTYAELVAKVLNLKKWLVRANDC